MKAELPPALKAQLSNRQDKYVDIMTILKQKNGPTSVNEILIGLWQNTQKVYERKRLLTYLFRLKQKGLIEGKNGIYKLAPNKEVIDEN